ncbi:GNAT family N-acetyltransferase [Photobacterium aphoticum]|uniref:Spermidine acetyltransferase n=1 Tax=Photobacterium aphoticum TaxID=754436 RepID=A0A0J1JD24_9GAMM|nr:GNAT family N-acetyltransferase [Photobacterium aphoticum]KLU99566.1 spermidine acetyltransferase [Photobacterium aphoticum]PSU56045.1 N-acetyltransferase [Photobacterium aphoticum]GHA53419.1 spermidine acetyltransferase [Photobacterium aphoticum]
MLAKEWKSENLIFSVFNINEPSVAKSIFDSNLAVQVFDPTFRDWSLSEYEKLIANSDQASSAREVGAFYFRKISTRDGTIVGYLQLEFNVPHPHTLWVPMLCILPQYQQCGFGTEIIESVINEARACADIERVGLNVYAENVKAFRFWFKQGFTQIKAFEPEVEFGKEYNCLVLYRELEAPQTVQASRSL